MAQPPGDRPLDPSPYLPLAVRAYTERAKPKKKQSQKGKPGAGWNLPPGFLIFDTETTTDPGQALTFGSAAYYTRSADGRLELIKRVLFHADELATSDPAGFDCLTSEARKRGIDLVSRLEFCDTILWRLAGPSTRAWIVGFNLPFDLSRLAVKHGEGRGRNYGGFSLRLWAREKDGEAVEHGYRSRVDVKALDSKRAFMSFHRTRGLDEDDLIPDGSTTGEPDETWTYHGHFLDLRTLCFALTNEAPNLEGACELFGVEGKKDEGKVEHGKITPRYIAYNLQDVEASARLCERLLGEYLSHPLDLPPTKAYSPASIGKAYLDVLGLKDLHQREARFPREKLGQAMSAYYGGRAECRIRGVPLPVVTVDFLSMYPTVNALMGVWPLISANRIKAVDATAEAQTFLDGLTADACFEPETWKQLPVICQVAPDGDVLPARCSYGTKAGWQIGCNPLTSSTPLWYALPDLCAAKLLGGKTPEILSAYRLVPEGRQAGLHSVLLRGKVEIDPIGGDPFRTLIEQRKLLDRDDELDEVDRNRLDQALKVVANSAGYGIFAEINDTNLGSRVEPIRVYGLDEPFEQKLSLVEEPGRFSFPPVAACITAAARLMLALLERQITDSGGSYVYCDTDAMAIVSAKTSRLIACPGGGHRTRADEPAVRALSWGETETIRERFTALNPYDRDAVPGSILQIEKVNFDEEHRRQLFAYSLSAKRYCLFTKTKDGHPVVHEKRRSEHGLGHLRNPLDPENEDRSWITESWQVILNDAHGIRGPKPRWVGRPAVSQLTASSPNVLRPFADYNEPLDYAARIKPFNFLLACQVVPFGHPHGYPPQRFQLIAPYTKDARQWERIPWTDRYSRDSFTIDTSGDLTNADVAYVHTYRSILDRYVRQPEPKSLGSDGRVCDGTTVGVLKRRPVTAALPAYIGKESNLLEERSAGLLHLDETLIHYSDPNGAVWTSLVRPALADMRTAEIAQRSGIVDRQVQRLVRGDSHPRRDTRNVLTVIAADHASITLNRWGIQTSRDPIACLTQYRDRRREEADLRTCPVCGKPPRSKRATYCSDACKSRARSSRIRYRPR